MDAKTLEMMESDEKIDKAAGSLVRSIYRAVTEHQYGDFGVTVTVVNGDIRQTKVITEISHNS